MYTTAIIIWGGGGVTECISLGNGSKMMAVEKANKNWMNN